MRALVTGATGFLGNYLVIELEKKGWDVFCPVRRSVSSSSAGIICLNADLANPDSLDDAMDQLGELDVIFHMGALLPQKQSHIELEDFLIANTISTCRLLKIASERCIKAFVFASGLPVIGEPKEFPITENHPVRPDHPYLLSKLTAELACELFRCQERMNVSSLRITSPYGPGMRHHTVLDKFVEKAICSENIEIYGSGQRIQNFIHISDVIRAFIIAANTRKPGVYNIAGSSSSMLNLAEKIISLVPTSSKIIFSNKPDPQENYRWQIDMTKSRDSFGYSPKTNFDVGLREYINWRIAGRPEPLWYDAS